MGMFDRINFEMSCPECGTLMNNFQSKDAGCLLDILEPEDVGNFYSGCHKCGHWIEFDRNLAQTKHIKVPRTLEQVTEMGFEMREV